MMDVARVGCAPNAIVNVMTHPVWAAMCIVLSIPVVDRLDKNPCDVIETGDWVKVDASRGVVKVTKKAVEKRTL
jgi:predicted aconitase with swiveling domain